MSKNINHIRLPRLISDGVVLQRNVELMIWGWASAGSKIEVGFAGRVYTCFANKDGRWAVSLSPLDAGGPYIMEIRCGHEFVLIHDILIGDVWVCSGQSNMTIPMSRVNDLYKYEISHCENASIRLYTVPDRYCFKEPQDDLETGSWVSADPETIMSFTAVGYFFAKALYEKYHIPIGLINASVGGSPAEAWMSEECLYEFPESLEAAYACKDDAFVNRTLKADEERINRWHDDLDRRDQGMADEKEWFDPEYNVSGWKVMQIPSLWKDAGLDELNGAVWFRKEIEVPASMTGVPAMLRLGRIVDSDTVYVNGTVVGATSYQYPPRRYSMGGNVLKKGKNIIVVRVVNSLGHGGFITGKPYRLEAGGQVIELTGEWQYKVGAVADPLPEQTFFQYKPLGLYNGMIAPLTHHIIKGVIWYQGESNDSRPIGYHRLLSAMIRDWRNKWGQGNFPFLYVQLPNYLLPEDKPLNSWALIREEQLKTLSVDNTAMAVAIDLGEWNDLHPLNKKDVGERLALAARHLAYGDSSVVYSGPVYKGMKIEDSRIVLSFDGTGRGLAAKGGGELKHFEIAGDDRAFVSAKAQIEGQHVIVWNDQVDQPSAVRYAWSDNPSEANLYNAEGLPASPFRTDN